MSRKTFSHTTEGDKDIAKYFVRAAAIRDQALKGRPMGPGGSVISGPAPRQSRRLNLHPKPRIGRMDLSFPASISGKKPRRFRPAQGLLSRRRGLRKSSLQLAGTFARVQTRNEPLRRCRGSPDSGGNVE